MEHAAFHYSQAESRRRHRRKRNMTAVLGGSVLFFALVGVSITLFFLFRFGAGVVWNYAAPKETPQLFETYLTDVVGLDPQPFGSLKAANAQWMLKASIWATVSKDQTVGAYGIDQNGRKILPEADVLKSYQQYFGAKAQPACQTFTDNGITYEYSAKLKCFYVPENVVGYIFTPKVSNIDRNGDTATLTVQYLPIAGWTKKPDGTTVAPSPSKTMIYVLRGIGGQYEIAAIRNAPSSQPQAAASSSSSPPSSAASSAASGS